MNTGLKIGDGITFGDGTTQITAYTGQSGGDVSLTQANTFSGQNTFNDNAVICNSGVDITGNLIFSNSNISQNGTISYANNNAGGGGYGLTNFVFDLPTTVSNEVSSEGGLLVNKYFTGNIDFNNFYFNTRTISWVIAPGTRCLFSLSLTVQYVYYSGLYSLYFNGNENTGTSNFTPITYSGNNGGTIEDYYCTFSNGDKGQFNLTGNSSVLFTNIQLYFIGAKFTTAPFW
jgi:hypothetical protein